MVYYLLSFFKSFSIISSLCFRVLVALLSSFGLSILLGNLFISKWRNWLQAGVRSWTPQSHQQKSSLPTMGGLFIFASILLSLFLWADLSSPYLWLFVACLTLFGAIGGLDDWSKIKKREGISARVKFRLQIGAGVVCMIGLFSLTSFSATLHIPCMQWTPNLGLFYVPWGVFVLVAMSNAVNLTDGLDGLATGSLIPNYVFWGLLASGIYGISGGYLPVLPELMVIAAAVVGSLAGFFWYNAHPARVFMGDVGSLSLGAGLAFMALMAKYELLLVISGGIFVAETLSVILQVASVKLRGKRLFKMAPIHHHFELVGWSETKIVTCFTAITFFLCLSTMLIAFKG